MKKHYLIYIVSFFLFSSCAIRINLKGLYGYYQKTKTESPHLLYKVTDLDSVSKNKRDSLNTKVLVVNGKTLKKYFEKNKKALIFIWGPRCSSQICFPPEILQSTCDSKNIELYIVAEYYDSEKMKINYNIKRPILGIDTEYYKTNLTSKYVKRFLDDIDPNSKWNDSSNRCLYFENGKFIKSYESVYSVE